MCEHEPHDNLKENSLLIENCGCAITDVLEDGTVVYSFEKLHTHFAEHEDMNANSDEDYDYAAEWIDYNVIRGLGYMGRSDLIMPRIVDEDGTVIYGDEDEEDCDGT